MIIVACKALENNQCPHDLYSTQTFTTKEKTSNEYVPS
jgi:hypothetical protein